ITTTTDCSRNINMYQRVVFFAIFCLLGSRAFVVPGSAPKGVAKSAAGRLYMVDQSKLDHLSHTADRLAHEVESLRREIAALKGSSAPAYTPSARTTSPADASALAAQRAALTAGLADRMASAVYGQASGGKAPTVVSGGAA
ncbi:unnamed protein product, partial [Heterosigma akashiwo]